MNGKCENCAKIATCKKEIGIIWGFCNTDFKPMRKREYYKYSHDEHIELYERVSNWQVVKYAPSGEPFIRIKGKIYTLSQFMPFSSPWHCSEPFEIKTDSGKTATLSASEIDGFPFPYFLEIDEYTERARAFRYYKTEFI